MPARRPPSGRSPRPGSSLPADVHLQAPPEPVRARRLRRPPRRRYRRLGRRLPVTADHVNPERPWPDLDVLRGGHRSPTGARLAPTARPSTPSGARAGALARPGAALPGARPLRRRGARPRRSRRPLPRARQRAPAPPPAPVPRSSSSATARRRGTPAPPAPRRRPRRAPRSAPRERRGRRRGAGRRARRPGARRRRARHAVRRPWARGRRGRRAGRRAARRETVGDTVTWVHNRNINYTNVCTFKCRFCGFSKGPLSLNLRGTPYLLTLDDIAARVAEAWEPGRHRGDAAGRHPPALRRRLLHRRHPRGEGPRPDIHVHGFTALEVTEGAKRLGEPLAALPHPAPRRRARQPARHGRRDPRRRRAGRAVPRQDHDRRVARRPRDAHAVGLRSQRHDHVRRHRAAGALGPPPRADPRAAAPDRRLHRVRAAAVRAHGGADLPPAPVPPRADVPRDRARPRRRAHRLPRAHRQRPGVVGEDRRRRVPASCCRPASTTSAGR